uniref:Putative PAS/PAC sensor protein n=1 Tax=Rhodopseudomonas palustris (strain BisA53) TaxID=316055 RepID=Q07V34_RHOP5
MQRFVCEQNISHFQKLLDGAADPTLRHTLESLLSTAKRDLALLNAELQGADGLPPKLRQHRMVDPLSIREQLRRQFDHAPHPYMLIDPGPGLHILDVNDAYAAATFIRRDDVVGKPLFEVLPDNPDLENADGVSNLYQSLSIVVKTGEPHAMAVQRYDIRAPNGQFVERHWQPINTPIHDDTGKLVCLLHHVEDVTPAVLAEADREAARPSDRQLGGQPSH